jgi:flagellar motor switch protein FliM
VKKILSQEEIDDMIHTARSGASAAAPMVQPPAVTVWDGRLAGRIGEEHMQAFNRLHQTFAHNLTHSLGAYLRIQFAAALVSGEHLSYAEFLQSIPEVTYLASCKLMPAGASALAQLDLSVAYPLIDVLLGGEGKGEAPARAMTQIEEQILETVMHIICRELQTAWQALSLEFQFEQRQHLGQVEQLMPAAEKILLLGFEITMLDNRGALNLAVPAQVSNALLRKMAERNAAKPRLRPQSEQRLRTRLLSCPFAVELPMLSLRVPLRSLVGLSPGMVLGLGRGTRHPATLLVAGQKMFTATVARRGSWRAAQVLARQVRRDAADERNP